MKRGELESGLTTSLWNDYDLPKFLELESLYLIRWNRVNKSKVSMVVTAAGGISVVPG